MAMNQQLKQMEAALVQAAIFEFAIGVLVTAFFFWMLYLVIRAAVRDGMKQAMEEGGRRRRPIKNTDSSLPDMRAD